MKLFAVHQALAIQIRICTQQPADGDKGTPLVPTIAQLLRVISQLCQSPILNTVHEERLLLKVARCSINT